MIVEGNGIDARTSGPWQSVRCADCDRVYTCQPLDDHYLRAGDPEGSPRVCFTCLTAPVPVSADQSGEEG